MSRLPRAAIDQTPAPFTIDPGFRLHLKAELGFAFPPDEERWIEIIVTDYREECRGVLRLAQIDRNLGTLRHHLGSAADCLDQMFYATPVWLAETDRKPWIDIERQLKGLRNYLRALSDHLDKKRALIAEQGSKKKYIPKQAIMQNMLVLMLFEFFERAAPAKYRTISRFKTFVNLIVEEADLDFPKRGTPDFLELVHQPAIRYRLR